MSSDKPVLLPFTRPVQTDPKASLDDILTDRRSTNLVGQLSTRPIPARNLGHSSIKVIAPASSSLDKFTPASRLHNNSISKLPDGPPPVPPPPPLKGKPNKPLGSSVTRPSPFQWQIVQRHKPPPKEPQRASHHVPTCSQRNGVKVQRSGAWDTAISGTVIGSTKSAAHADAFRRRGETMDWRDEASKTWRKGDGANLPGGETAFYVAGLARAYTRCLLSRKRSENHDMIDLHGVTVSEAITIVREILAEGAVSKKKDLKIITGRGSHSVNNVSVLKPAITKALKEDGWSVTMWDAGLVVRK
ncbi:hypothetical protein CVT24_010774 [Panaeolus cyanescens]|uniref:Smr domain-containing protein n=1 Tax=Panaeolus cyanescens TaxID=181874 RepID=A0A409YVZ7_9AGAR|nr:hypothetical protein CVT24_010774 [Panaeolus cyanescens]